MMRQITKRLLVAGAIWWVIPACMAQEDDAPPDANETIRPLIVEAIRNGHAQGELGGRIREAFARMFATSAPILVDVKRLDAIPKKPGCYRLSVTTTQAGVYEFDVKTKVRKTTPSDMKLGYMVSYCSNGRFPGEEGQ